MSLSGVLNTHFMGCYLINRFGTDEQKQRLLPKMATGEMRAALAMSEPEAGSDVQAIKTKAIRDGDDYVVNGQKMWLTNGLRAVDRDDARQDRPCGRAAPQGHEHADRREGARRAAAGPRPRRRQEHREDGLQGRRDDRDDVQRLPDPGLALLGTEEGQGFRQVLDGIELGRVNVAARAVGVATRAFEEAIRYAQERKAFGKPIAEHQAIQIHLAEMGTTLEAARLMLFSAAAKKSAGERSDLEAGMAKLFASEACNEIVLKSLRVHGGYGYSKEFTIERLYRDAPFLLIGEGTSEIQKTVIARRLLERYKA